MNINEKQRTASGQCPDELALQLYLEGETESSAQELIFHHLAQCRACAETLAHLRELKTFCLERFGEDDLREDEFTRRVLQEVRQELQRAAPRRLPPWQALVLSVRSFSWPRIWRMRFALAAATVLAVVGGGFWLLSERQPALSAKAVLDEAELRERLWEYQPGKVLHSVIEESITNSLSLSDGQYRSLHWRSNVAGQQASLIRKYDAQDQLIWARWIRPDGSQTVFNQRDNGKLTITPGLAALRAELAAWPAEQRQELETIIAKQEIPGEPQNVAGQAAEMIRRNWEAGKVRIVETPDFGRVFRLHFESAKESEQGRVKQFEMDQDMSAATFRRTRLSSRRWLADGRVWTEEARWVLYREASLEEFAANDLSNLLKQAKNVEQVSAKAHALWLLEIHRRIPKHDVRRSTSAGR